MRHDPASAAVIVMLRGLKMYGMSQAVSDLIEQGAPAFEAAVPRLLRVALEDLAHLVRVAVGGAGVDVASGAISTKLFWIDHPVPCAVSIRYQL